MFLLVKLAVASGAVAWLYSRELLNVAILKDVPRSMDTVFLVCGGFASMSLAIVMLALRLRILLRFKRFDVGVSPAILVTFISYFFGTLLPGTIGADAVRVTYFCRRVAERRMDVLTAILFDRIVGLYSLLLLSSLALAAIHLAGMWRDSFAIMIAAPAAFGVATVGGILYACMDGKKLPRAIIDRMPWRIKAMAAGFSKLLRDFPVLLSTVALSLLSHIFMVFTFVVVATVIADPLPLYLHFVISPMAVTINSVPLSPGGLGITEGAFAYLFYVVGSGNGALIGLLGRVLQYSVYAVGGSVSLLFLRWRGKPYESISI